MVDKRAIKEMGKKTFNAVKTAMELAVSFPYFGPSFVRKTRKPDGGIDDNFTLLCSLLNILHVVGSGFMAYDDIVPKMYPFFVLGTHTASGLYEWYRYEKNKVSPSTTSTSTSSTGKKSGLEEAVKESSETNHPIDPKTYKNPFEIELPKNDKIESLVYGGNE